MVLDMNSESEILRKLHQLHKSNFVDFYGYFMNSEKSKLKMILLALIIYAF